MVYKWCQCSIEEDAGKPSGAANPLDRLAKIYAVTQDPQIISWVCQLADGYFVKNPKSGELKFDDKVLKNIQNFIKEFSEALEAISESYATEKRITVEEAKVIRKEWEDLKSVGEGFVRACESGKFDK